jgi:hypothetical protein
MNVFLSFSFRSEDREFVEQLQSLLRSHGVQAVTGRVLDGEGVTPAVLAKVESSDALVALMTRRDRIGNADENRWRTHPWVRDEINHARGKNKPAIALLETGVEPEGAYSDNERLTLDRDNPLKAFLALSERLANWKQRFGRSQWASIVPADLGHRVIGDSAWSCSYRFWSKGDPGDWREGKLMPAQGGTQLYVRGIQDDDALIEVQVKRHDEVRWRSVATSQQVTIELAEQGGSG